MTKLVSKNSDQKNSSFVQAILDSKSLKRTKFNM